MDAEGSMVLRRLAERFEAEATEDKSIDIHDHQPTSIDVNRTGHRLVVFSGQRPPMLLKGRAVWNGNYDDAWRFTVSRGGGGQLVMSKVFEPASSGVTGSVEEIVAEIATTFLARR